MDLQRAVAAAPYLVETRRVPPHPPLSAPSAGPPASMPSLSASSVCTSTGSDEDGLRRAGAWQ